MTLPTLARAIAETLATIVEGADRAPGPQAPVPLEALFQRLRSTDSSAERIEAEDMIWAVWHSHPDSTLERRMASAIGAIARRELGTARTVLDALVTDAPGWAEAWNKRATLSFLEDRDLDSVDDIRRTVELEPRHFGAMGGFGQICLRAGDEASALVAFQMAVRVNPNLEALRTAAAAIEQRLRGTMH